ncbi:uncharacterized protein BX663DRAFT_531402 [Cokeromyces recurvatus]|uniref:uncharacterized protein n=1 Tax=Cokeromyces recurvatus TaxID=90255 RepID=UPI002220E097|nr:uncharacterized protein BX663DRAFT_531402 [Cokeromyces recurvatus]KAI7902464.1 hypothetical protein BX663DRAFT_531402 [Cokeromyces recurvatus]
MVKYVYKWPKDISNNKTISSNNVFKEIDNRYCGQDRCRFLLPVYISEQESKAQLHFRQIAFLAGKLGRTIVLPNVHNSHLGSCLPHPFRFYYDQSWLDNNKEHFKYITMEDFKEWVLERRFAGAIPTAQEIFLQGVRKSRLMEKAKNCFQSSFDFSNRPIVGYQVPDHHNPLDLNITNIFVNLLSDEAREYEYFTYKDQLSPNEEDHGINNNKATDLLSSSSPPPPVDVINLFYDRRYKFIEDQDANIPLPYNQKWVEIADKISSQLKPYVAIHWRMETLKPVSNLLPCAKDLIDKISQLTSQKAPNVFLLTDYPHLLNTTGARPESSSFNAKQLVSEHHEAIQYLYEHTNITLTSINNGKIPYAELPSQNWHILPINATSSEDNLPLDRSVLGIVDKLVAMNAQWFFAGRPGVCAKASSFTGRISHSRLDAFMKGDKNVIIPIKTFDIKKEEN